MPALAADAARIQCEGSAPDLHDPRRRDTAGHSCERAASDNTKHTSPSSIMSKCFGVAIHQPERRTYDLQQEVRSVRWQDNSVLWTQG